VSALESGECPLNLSTCFGRESLPRSRERSARQIAGGGLSENLTPNTRHLLVIEAGRAGRYYWRNIWGYRELFAILAWRDVAVRYKQTVIGVAWPSSGPSCRW
jgi:hypothetical protein